MHEWRSSWGAVRAFGHTSPSRTVKHTAPDTLFTSSFWQMWLTYVFTVQS